ncbi:MAG: class B sortase [Clostridiales bacterium]|nr:class B sortase [Clostridiales bacterium]
MSQGQQHSYKKRKKKGVGDYLLTVILILAVAVFFYAGYNLVQIYLEYKAGTDEYDGIAKIAVTERENTSETSEEDPVEMEAQPQAPIEVDFDSLLAINEDVVGWIYMEALTDINYPVVQGVDNDQYLHTTYENNYNFAGTIFIDYQNSRDLTDCNTIVYGHNMKNGSMFGQLKKYVSDESLYEDSPYFWILTPEVDYRYEIIAAYTTAVNSDTYTLFEGAGQEFLDYMTKIESQSEIATDPGDPQLTDKVVTLSTCTGNSATRFVVQGKMVNAVAAQ